MEDKILIRNELNNDQVVNLSEAAIIIPLDMSWIIASKNVRYGAFGRER